MTRGRRPAVTLAIFALANAGGVIGFLPLLTQLVPIRAEALAGDDRIGVFTAALVAGAVAASIANIAFGWLSDRSVARGGGRRRFVAGGIVATAVTYAAIAGATTPLALVAGVVAFQVALNAVIAPMLAALADEVPRNRLGVAGGLLSLGQPLAAAVTATVMASSVLGEGGRYAAVVAAMTACLLPMLLLPGMRQPAAPHPPARAAALRRDLAAAWAARLCVQVAGGVLFHYLLFYFESVTPGTDALSLSARVGALMTIAYLLPLPVAVLLGRLTDRRGGRRRALGGSAAVAAAALAVMAATSDARVAAAGFALYALGSATFLSLHAAFAIHLLPDGARRGRDLGLVNLANTLPGIIGPALAWTLAGPESFARLMLALAAITAVGGGLIALVSPPPAAPSGGHNRPASSGAAPHRRSRAVRPSRRRPPG